MIGPGRVGCGFAGQLLRASGFDVVFVARNPVLVDHFNRVRHYRICLSESEEAKEVDTMQRVAFLLGLRSEADVPEYKARHDHIWPEMSAALREAGRVVSDDELGRKLDARFGPLTEPK